MLRPRLQQRISIPNALKLLSLLLRESDVLEELVNLVLQQLVRALRKPILFSCLIKIYQPYSNLQSSHP